MIRVIPVVVLLAILAGLHWRLVAAPAWSRRSLRRGIDLALVACAVAVLVGFGMVDEYLGVTATRAVAWLGLTWLAWVLYVVLGLLVATPVLLALRIARRHHDPARRRAVSTTANRTTAVVVVTLSLVVTAYGLVEANRPSLTPVTVTSTQLPPSFDGLTVALVTDTHIGPVRDAAFLRRVVTLVNEAEPDIVVLGGDIIDGATDRHGVDVEPLAELQAPLGVFGVSGNHELYSGQPAAWLALWESHGVRVLRNESVVLERGGDHIVVAGIHDWSFEGTDAPDIGRALTDRNPDDFILLAAHEPRQATTAQRRGIDLQVSGHTHGGQLWPGRYLVPLQQPLIDGLGTVGDIAVVTSRGAGAWASPVRVLAPPEVPIITLRAR